MGRRKIQPAPPAEELQQLYITDNRRLKELAAQYHVSVDTIKTWLASYGISKFPKRRPFAADNLHSGRPRSDPKRNSWLNEDGEAPPLRPNVAVVPTDKQRFVVKERRAKSAPAKREAVTESARPYSVVVSTKPFSTVIVPDLPNPVTPAEAAPLLRKASESPYLRELRSVIAQMVAYKLRAQLRWEMLGDNNRFDDWLDAREEQTA